MKEYINFESEKGYLKSILATNSIERESISDNISMNSDMSESKFDKLFEYLDEKDLKVGFISDFRVNNGFRGTGAGNSFIEKFKENVVKNTDVDILIARIEGEQSDGFDLEVFYEKHGFKGVMMEYGDMLMVTKGYEHILDDVLGLKEERKNALKWFEENGVGEHQKVKDFFDKRETEELKHKVKPKKRKKRTMSRL